MTISNNSDKSTCGMTTTGTSTDEICPVCLLDDVELVKTPCRHKVCLPCMERLLTVPVIPASERNRVHSPIPNDDDDLDIPTRGRCPMCREPICLFDLEKVNCPPGENQLAISKNHNISSTGLAGRVYIRNRSTIGDHSIHFPVPEDGANALPYIDFSLDQRIQAWSRREPTDLKMYFQPDCHFHEGTRTFHGRIRWSDNCSELVLGSRVWEYSIAFSGDFQYATRGVVIKRRDACQNPDCMKSTCKFWFDGRWKVSWPDIPDRSQRTYTIHNNTGMGGKVVVANLDDTNLGIGISYNDYSRKEGHVINLESKKRWWKDKESIKIAETIEIDAPPEHPNQRMLWTREAFGSRHLDVLSIGVGSSQVQYHTVSPVEIGGSKKPVYVSSSIWGNTFSQGLCVGLASYHFMENIQEGAYISYENERASRWPPLDNGSPIPNKVWFTETSFDASTRIFRGKIDWHGAHGTTWQGCRCWRYEMHFSPNYSCILGGQVKSLPMGSDNEIDMSIFGNELVYINAGLVQQCNDSGDFGLVEGVIQMIEEKFLGSLTVEDLRKLMNFMILFQEVLGHRGTVEETTILRYPRSFQFS